MIKLTISPEMTHNILNGQDWLQIYGETTCNCSYTCNINRMAIVISDKKRQ